MTLRDMINGVLDAKLPVIDWEAVIFWIALAWGFFWLLGTVVGFFEKRRIEKLVAARKAADRAKLRIQMPTTTSL